MLIKALYPNLPNGFDFLCELIMSSRSLKQLENGHSQRSLKNLKQYNKIFSFPVLKVNIIWKNEFFAPLNPRPSCFREKK